MPRRSIRTAITLSVGVPAVLDGGADDPVVLFQLGGGFLLWHDFTNGEYSCLGCPQCVSRKYINFTVFQRNSD